MRNAYPLEFRWEVVQVESYREQGLPLEKIDADFGIHPITLSTHTYRMYMVEEWKA